MASHPQAGGGSGKSTCGAQERRAAPGLRNARLCGSGPHGGQQGGLKTVRRSLLCPHMTPLLAWPPGPSPSSLSTTRLPPPPGVHTPALNGSYFGSHTQWHLLVQALLDPSGWSSIREALEVL